MTKAAYPTIGIAAFVIFAVYFIGCLPFSTHVKVLLNHSIVIANWSYSAVRQAKC